MEPGVAVITFQQREKFRDFNKRSRPFERESTLYPEILMGIELTSMDKQEGNRRLVGIDLMNIYIEGVSSEYFMLYEKQHSQ